MGEFLRQLHDGFVHATLLDQANLVLGVVGVVLMIRRSLWAFPIGLVAVTVQGILFYQTRYYADATLQAVFFGALVYGWWHWVEGGKRAAQAELPVTRLSVPNLAVTLGLTTCGWLVWAWYLRTHTDAIMPGRDAFIAAFSVAGQWLQARKKRENWAFWMVVNAVATATYAAGGLSYTAVLYAIYLGLAVAGWRAWKRTRTDG